jgi:hypothetical protein
MRLFVILLLFIAVTAFRPPCRIVVNEHSEYVTLEGYNPLESFRVDTAYAVMGMYYWISCDNNFVSYDTETEKLFVTIPNGYIECENYNGDSLRLPASTIFR